MLGCSGPGRGSFLSAYKSDVYDAGELAVAYCISVIPIRGGELGYSVFCCCWSSTVPLICIFDNLFLSDAFKASNKCPWVSRLVKDWMAELLQMGR